jgi:hypothetical protein
MINPRGLHGTKGVRMRRLPLTAERIKAALA